MDHIKKLQYEL